MVPVSNEEDPPESAMISNEHLENNVSGVPKSNEEDPGTITEANRESEQFLTQDDAANEQPDVEVRSPRKSGFKRYKGGLAKALPIRFKQKPKDTLPLDVNGLCSYMTFGWFSPIIWRIYRQGIKPIKALRLPKEESAEVAVERIERFWNEELETKGTKDASFGKALFNSFKTRVLIGAFISLLNGFLTLANPMLVIRFFLEYLSEGNDVTLSGGIVYVVLMTLVIMLRSLAGTFFWMLNFEAGIRIKNGTLALLYKKIVHVKHLQDKTVGELVNFIGNDGLRIWYGIIMGPYIIGGPIIIIMGCVYSVVYIGPWALLAVLIIFGFYPFAMSLAKKSMDFRSDSIKITDRRVMMTSELLNSIKLIKMYAWEGVFGSKITGIREDEQKILEKSTMAQSGGMGSSMLVAIFASILTFIGYVGSGNNLTPMQAFTFLALMNMVQASMVTIPFALKSISEMMVSMTRMKEILLMSSMQSHNATLSNPSSVIELKNASFTWAPPPSEKDEDDHDKDAKANDVKDEKRGKEDHEEKMMLQENNETEAVLLPSLKSVNFSLQRGQLVGVCGQVGCGKSSLISACLGRMNVMLGTVAVSGDIAYASQQAWITNDTVRDNILFGQEYDEDRYKEILEACSLTEDLRNLPSGDMTEVGERGTNLSGGQKQRISLARAVYSDHDLVLLDDPLSAVDVHVGHHIFHHCVLKYLKGRSVLFVTHQLQYLKECDEVLVMQDGMIIEQGTYSELSTKGGEFSSLINVYNKEKGKLEKRVRDSDEGEKEEDGENGNPHGDGPAGNSVDNRIDGMSSPSDADISHLSAGDTSLLIQEEEIEEGPVKWPAIRQYIGSMGGFPIFALVIFCFSLPVAGVTTASWYLYFWLNEGGGNATMVLPDNSTVPSMRVVDNPDRDTYLYIFAAFLPILIVCLVIRSISITKSTLKAATGLHHKSLTTILHCPMSFFDTTPVGRILNRFTSDLDEVDTRLPMNAEIFLTNVLQTIAAIAMIIYVSPWFALACLPLGLVFYFLFAMFHTCIQELKNLDNVTRSPVMSHMGATVQGLTSIFAYQKMQDFFKRHCELLNANATAVFLFYSANRWLAFWLDVLSAIIMFLTGILILATYDILSPGLAGLALCFAIQISGLFQFTAQLAVETEARFASAQRILEYANVDQQETSDEAANIKPSNDWPSSGEIVFKAVNLRYRSGLPLALKGLDFTIRPSETIGVVGRTGAGKTSLSTALFRLVELDSGHLTVDGVDVSSISLHDLRSRVSVIPQDPVLFVGSLRNNLDPFGEYSDADLWQALERCHVADMVKSHEHRLDLEVQEGGNFSVGEKQLLCMARTLLRKSKILILDEATAAIDAETDALIQTTLRETFSDCTMLIIAHRLATVTGCDRIMVMEGGKVVEFDSPSALLGNSKSKFKAMLEASESES